MGWCDEFSVEIKGGCTHSMVASTDCCICPECGARCTGKFKGCAVVWARGPIRHSSGARRPRNRTTGEPAAQPSPVATLAPKALPLDLTALAAATRQRPILATSTREPSETPVTPVGQELTERIGQLTGPIETETESKGRGTGGGGGRKRDDDTRKAKRGATADADEDAGEDHDDEEQEDEGEDHDDEEQEASPALARLDRPVQQELREALSSVGRELAAAVQSRIPDDETLVQRISTHVIENLPANDEGLQELRVAQSATVKRVDKLARRIADTPTEDALVARVQERIDALTESVVGMLAQRDTALEKRIESLTEALAQRDEQIQGALARRDAELRQIGEGLTSAVTSLHALQQQVDALPDENSLTRRQRAALTEALALRDARLKELQRSQTAGVQRVEAFETRLAEIQRRLASQPDADELLRAMTEIVQRAFAAEGVLGAAE
jgi:hypothetical protein